ncbi:MAG: hypothetical protein K2K09_05570, partial [Lachnospiraceae bacterium]|nr:hypothetical protein [Lachnospiraceae bacterium]
SRVIRLHNAYKYQNVYKYFKYKQLKKNAKSFKIKVKNAKGRISYRSSTRHISISNGKVKIRRGIPRGSYKIIVTAVGNHNFNSSSKTVKIVVK